jgi:hypothetical protein
MKIDQNSNLAFVQFLLRAQQVGRDETRSENGYVMIMTVIISVMLFSMMGAYLTITNLSKLSTNAYADGASTFYAAESGLNTRAQELRQKFVGYAMPSGSSPANISSCFPLSIAATASTSGEDFACRNYGFRYNNNSAVNLNSNGETALSGGDDNKNSVNYVAYTFVVDRTDYTDLLNKGLGPKPSLIPSGQAYAGLNAQKYKYTVYATANANVNVTADFTPAEIAAKNRELVPANLLPGDNVLITLYNIKRAKADAANASKAASNTIMNTSLQLDFESRVIPLFQFGAFYNNDLDISPYSRMDIYGRIHTNKTLTINSNDSNGLHFAGSNAGVPNDSLDYAITAVGDIYTKDTANTGGNGSNYLVMPTGTQNITLSDGRVVKANLLANNKDTPLNNSASAPADYKLDHFSPYLLNHLSSTPVPTLTLPTVGFLRKTDATGAIGEYYGKADLRLTMRFNRAIPFDLTVIKTGAADGSTCTSGLNISSDRMGKSTSECNVLNKGKLKSLMQPVLALTKGNTNERDRFCKQSIPVRQTDATIANYNLNSVDSIIANSTLNGLSNASKDKILRALQVAISSASNRVSYENVTTTGVLPNTEKTTFKNLLDRLKTTDLTLAAINTTTISALPPATIAAIRSSCFLPAPIQKLDAPGTTPYDLREDRAMSLFQTNIESLTVWNRDGVYVNFDTDLTIPGTATTANINAAFDDLITITPTTYSTNNSLFTRSEISAVTTSNYQTLGYNTFPAQSFQALGLGAIDRTEGGLVLHATIDDTDFLIDPTDKKRKYGTNATNNFLKSQSPFGLVVSGGKNLPSPLTIASDQAIYIQGDYNNFGFVNITTTGAKQPAAILADTITVLSNSCLSGGIGTIISGAGNQAETFPRGQINCLFNDTRANRTKNNDDGQSRKATPTSVFAAFASNNEASCGNLGSHTDATYCTDRNARSNVDTTFRSASSQYFSGAFHNYTRMLEQWTIDSGGTKIQFTYRGSMVNLGLPQEFNGLTVWENVYDMPNRDWGYDLTFNSYSNLPPLTPRVVYLKQDMFRRGYQ